MWDMNEVTRIEYRDAYLYWIVFDDGLCGEVDFEPLLGRGPVFEPLRNLELFKQARIEGGTITWPNGADIAPESLYEKLESAVKALHAERLQPSASGVR
jgi:hypothetical protein